VSPVITGQQSMGDFVVVVLGDIGRSPRMQNHSLALSKISGSTVHIVGYNESPIFKELQDAPNVKVHGIRPFPKLPRVLFPLYAPLKILWLFIQLIKLIFTLPKFYVLLAQNPPSVPSIPFCWILTRLKGKRFVIDWHNFGYTLLEAHKTNHIIVRIAKYLEFFFGRAADAHITVTEALRGALRDRGIMSEVVYDRPNDLFKPCKEARSEFAQRLKIDANDIWLISSTSWTPDEQIEMILVAAEAIEEDLKKHNIHLTIIITGKGPGRRSFECEVRTRHFTNISWIFEFFEKYEDYARFLGCCDIGASFHVSSSGLDLPMKGLDMIGAGLPLISVSYRCITELVNEGINGVLFRDGEELGNVLRKLIVTKEIDLRKLAEGSVESSKVKWEEIWRCKAEPVLFDGKK
jgi:beta-1,4-mannosyltransferase